MLKCGWKNICRYLVDRVCRVTGALIDAEQGGFREGRGYVEQIFTLKQIDEKAQAKMWFVCEFYRFRESI